MEMQKNIIVVLGSHRCGTSALTRSLSVLGISLGNNFNPPLKDDNETGYWEDLDVLSMNNKLLKASGQTWRSITPLKSYPQSSVLHNNSDFQEACNIIVSKFMFGNTIGIKDPRVAKLLPFWQAVFSHLDLKVTYIIACRHPMSTALSLAKRLGFPKFKAYWLWYADQLASLYYTENESRLIVDYDQLIADPKLQLQRIATHLSIPFNDNSPELHQYINNFLVDSLRHSYFTLDDLRSSNDISADITSLYQLQHQIIHNMIDNNAANAFITSAWEKHKNLHAIVNLLENQVEDHLKQITIQADKTNNLLDEIAKLKEINEYSQKTILELQQKMLCLVDEILYLKKVFIDLENINHQYQQALSQVTQAFHEIQSSTSWKITQPLRSFSELLRKYLKKQPTHAHH